VALESAPHFTPSTTFQSLTLLFSCSSHIVFLCFFTNLTAKCN